MIAALSGWLKQIIVMILIATFVDLILPSKSMGRYVKVVVSLFLLLAILSPIIQLLRSDFELELALTTDRQLQQGTEFVPVQGVITSGNEIRSQQEEQALQVLEERLEQVILEEVESEFPVQILDIDVVALIDQRGEATLQKISLLASPHAHKVISTSKTETRYPPNVNDFDQLNRDIAHMEPIKPIEPIEPIRPVETDHSLGQSASHDRSAMSSAITIQAEASEAIAQLSQQISSWLAQRWQVPHSTIQITIAE